MCVQNIITKYYPKYYLIPDRRIYELNLLSDEGEYQEVEVTDDHPFYVSDFGWKETLDLSIGDKIERADGSVMTVESLVDKQRYDLTYNFTVEDFHTYYVTNSELLVHNCGGEVAKGPATISEKVRDIEKRVRNGETSFPLDTKKTLDSVADGMADNIRRQLDKGNIDRAKDVTNKMKGAIDKLDRFDALTPEARSGLKSGLDKVLKDGL